SCIVITSFHFDIVFYGHRFASFLDYSICAFPPSNGNESGVLEKVEENALKKIVSSLYTHGKEQKVNHFAKILRFFISLTLNSRESEKMKGFAKIFFSSTGRSLKRQK
ncbi:MAG: hypothetical protein J6D19_03360, partial [Clostridia bacterium]|nr:hypothetical protein [Clostridia bacterium]